MAKEKTTLDRIIEELPSSNMTQQIREMCDLISEEEHIEHEQSAPSGPNIFLVLEVPGMLKGDIGFLTLERENEDLYLGTFWSKRKDKEGPMMKKKVNTIEGNTAKKIMYQFAKLVKFYRGE